MSAPAVAVTQNGAKIVIAWKDIRTREPNVYWSVGENGRIETEKLVHSSARGPQDHPSVSMDGGATWVSWEDGRSGTPQIRARSSTAATELVVSSPSDGIVGYPSLAARNGLVAVAYESESNGDDRVLVRVLAPGR